MLCSDGWTATSLIECLGTARYSCSHLLVVRSMHYRAPWVQIWGWLLITCASYLTSLCFSIIVCETTYFKGLLWELNESIHVKHFEQLLAHEQYKVSHCYYLYIFAYMPHVVEGIWEKYNVVVLPVMLYVIINATLLHSCQTLVELLVTSFHLKRNTYLTTELKHSLIAIRNL